MENRKFEIYFYKAEALEEYKKITVNQGILVTRAIQAEAKGLNPFNVRLDVEYFSLYLYFTTDEIQVNEELKVLVNWLNEKRWDHD